MKKIDLFCLLTPIKVTLISFVLALFISFLFIKISPPAEEYLDELNLGTLRVYLVMIVSNFLASLFSISIALNTTKSVRDNFWLSLLTFYMPALLMFPFVLSMSLNVSLFVYFIMPIPFLIPQTYYFVHFRKRLKSGEIMDDFGEK